MSNIFEKIKLGKIIDAQKEAQQRRNQKAAQEVICLDSDSDDSENSMKYQLSERNKAAAAKFNQRMNCKRKATTTSSSSSSSSSSNSKVQHKKQKIKGGKVFDVVKLSLESQREIASIQRDLIDVFRSCPKGSHQG